MAKKRRSKKPEKQETKVQQDYISYYNAVKSVAGRLGPIKFVIVDDYETQIRVHIEDGKTTINGKEVSDEQVRNLIVASTGSFERLFLEAAKRYDEKMTFIPAISLAKMTDIAGKAKRPVQMEIADATGKNQLKIERVGERGMYHLNGKSIETGQAENFIRKNYSAYLLSMKQAVKEAKSFKVNMTYDTEFSAKRPKAEMTVSGGKITVDIRKYLSRQNRGTKRKVSEEKQKEMMTLRGQILQNGRKKGYVEA